MEYRIIKKDAFRIVGARKPLDIELLPEKSEMGKGYDDVAVEGAFKCVPKFWEESAKNGNIAKVCTMIDNEPLGLLGVSANYCFIKF